MYEPTSVPQEALQAEPIILTDEQRLSLLRVYQYRKTIICFTLIDGFFCTMNALTTGAFIYLMGLVLVVCGYYGAKNYNENLINCYRIYNVFSLLSIVLILSMLSNEQEEHSDDRSIVPYFFGILSMVVDMWVLRLCCQFQHFIKSLRNDEVVRYLLEGKYQFVQQSPWNSSYLW